MMSQDQKLTLLVSCTNESFPSFAVLGQGDMRESSEHKIKVFGFEIPYSEGHMQCDAFPYIFTTQIAVSRFLGTILDFCPNFHGEQSAHSKRFRAPRLLAEQGNKVVKHLLAASRYRLHSLDIHSSREISQLFDMSGCTTIYTPKSTGSTSRVSPKGWEVMDYWCSGLECALEAIDRRIDPWQRYLGFATSPLRL